MEWPKNNSITISLKQPKDRIQPIFKTCIVYHYKHDIDIVDEHLKQALAPTDYIYIATVEHNPSNSVTENCKRMSTLHAKNLVLCIYT